MDEPRDPGGEDPLVPAAAADPAGMFVVAPVAAALEHRLVVFSGGNPLLGTLRLERHEFQRVIHDLRSASAAAATAPELPGYGQGLEALPPRHAPAPVTRDKIKDSNHENRKIEENVRVGAGGAKENSESGDKQNNVSKNINGSSEDGGSLSSSNNIDNEENQRRNNQEAISGGGGVDAEDDDDESVFSSSSSRSNSTSSSSSSFDTDDDGDDNSDGSGDDGSSESSDSDDEITSSESDSVEGEPHLGGREEQEAYRKFSTDKELFHLIHRILANDATTTSLSLLPESDRVLASTDWDTASLLTHKHAHRPLTRRELLQHVARQRQAQQPQFGVPTGAQLVQQALAMPPLFLREMQIYCPLIANRLSDGADQSGALVRFLSTCTSLREFTLFHTSTGAGTGDNNPPHNRVIPGIIAALAESTSIRRVALRKLALPAGTDCGRLLQDTKTLKELELAYCVLQPDLTQSLKVGLSQNDTLEHLILRKDLNDSTPSFVPIWEGLKEHSRIQELNVECMTCQQLELDFLGYCVASTPKLAILSLIVASNMQNTVSQRAARVSNTNFAGLNEALSAAAQGVAHENLLDIPPPPVLLPHAAAIMAAIPDDVEDRDTPRPSKPGILNASSFFQSLVEAQHLRKLRLHPYVTLQDPEQAWATVLDDSSIETFDFGQGLSRQTNPTLVTGTMESLLTCHNQKIKELNLNNSYCHGELSLRQVFMANMVNQHKSLAKLHLRNCRLMDSDIDGLADCLGNCLSRTVLKELDLGSNYISYRGMESLARALSQGNNVIESLDLSFNSFGHFSCATSFAILLQSKTLKCLDVSCTDIFTDHLSSSGHRRRSKKDETQILEVVEVLRKALADNKVLIRLDADDNGFSDPLAIAFFIGIRDNTCLKELSVDGNSLRLATPECRQSLVEMLTKNKTLTSLNLPRNRGMTEAGFRSLTSGLKRNKSLQNVAVRVLCEASLPKLLTAVLASQSLVRLTVALPSSSDRAEAENRILSLLKCTSKVKTFQSLVISNAEHHLISPSTGRLLLDILRKNSSLHFFNLSLALCPGKLREMIDFYVELNRRGRRFLDASAQQPIGLWPHILAPLTKKDSGCAMYLHFFIREHVALHQRNRNTQRSLLP